MALNDLESIAIGASNDVAAATIPDRLFDTFQLIAEHPEIGTWRNDLGAEVQVFTPQNPACNYLVFIYTIPKGVAIAGIVHGARDWNSLFQSDERIAR
ncbi:MAG: type II toxin-antitoxin system RelE/ParE family toxin [Pirellulaceae bacterium]|nr:type II toxin-antitoxin system RelE/ParE family toxin [Pirellulaceae bacterium]